MKKAIITLILCINYHVFAQTFEWAKNIGPLNTILENGSSSEIEIDEDGNIYTLGNFTGTVDFDPGPETFEMTSVGSYDVYILKQNQSGDFIWAKSLGGDSYGRASDLAILPDGSLVICGDFSGAVDFDPSEETHYEGAAGFWDPYIVKLDSDGNFQWVNTYKGSNIGTGRSLEVDNAGDIIMVGAIKGPTDFDPGPEIDNYYSTGGLDIYILKLNSDGEFIWIKQIGDELDEAPWIVVADEFDNLYITGILRSETVDFDPGDGIFNLANEHPETWDTFILKLNAEGNFQWAKEFGGSGEDRIRDLAITEDDHIYLIGSFGDTVNFNQTGEGDVIIAAGDEDVFLQKLGLDGTYKWTTNSFASAYEGIVKRGYAIDTDIYGDAYIVYGVFAGDLDENSYIQQINPEGELIWTGEFGTAGNRQLIFDITLDNSGDIYATGIFNALTDFDPSDANSFELENTAAGESDALILKLNPFYAGIFDQEELTISVFPNPTANTLSLTCEKELANATIHIADLTGKIILKTTLAENVIDVSNLPSGTYFMNIHLSSGFSFSKQFIVAR